jgi:hypothetical protein
MAATNGSFFAMPSDSNRGSNGTVGDLLLGGRAVAAYVNSLLDPTTQITSGQLYAWVERGHVPVTRVGNRIIASKERLRAALSGIKL